MEGRLQHRHLCTSGYPTPRSRSLPPAQPVEAPGRGGHGLGYGWGWYGRRGRWEGKGKVRSGGRRVGGGGGRSRGGDGDGGVGGGVGMGMARAPRHNTARCFFCRFYLLLYVLRTVALRRREEIRGLPVVATAPENLTNIIFVIVNESTGCTFGDGVR